MRTDSPFLFDDREYFYYGEVVLHESTSGESSYSAALRKIRNQTANIVCAAAAATSIVSGIYVKTSVASSPAHITVKSSARVGDGAEDDLRRSLVKNREFLGLKQKQVALILGLSESTIEKVEQGVYLSQSVNTKEMVSTFNDWVRILKQAHGERKFIVRPFINSKMNALGGISPLEYALKNPGTGLNDLIGLERKIYG